MNADRIFLDANILFSVAYGSKGLKYLWDCHKEGICILLASEYVIEEARRNLYSTAQLKRLDQYLAAVEILPEADPTIPCPIDLPAKDKPVFMAAAIAKADFLLTGDVTHFGKYFDQTHGGVIISSVRNYFKMKEKVANSKPV